MRTEFHTKWHRADALRWSTNPAERAECAELLRWLLASGQVSRAKAAVMREDLVRIEQCLNAG